MAMSHFELVEAVLDAQKSAITDSLTDLLSRRGYDLLATQACAFAMRTKQRIAIIVLDLDGLKQVNDSSGHSAGDDLIKSAAHILSRNSRKNDVVARTGGDEFVILFTYSEDHTAREHMDKIVGDLTSAGISSSAGISTTGTPDKQFKSLGRLFEEADKAMYEEKRLKKSTAQIHLVR